MLKNAFIHFSIAGAVAMTKRDLVGAHIESLKPYVPGKPLEELQRELGIRDPIKLASNENPLGPSPKAVEAMQAAMGRNHFYPDGAAYEMVRAIAEFHDVAPEQVITGNGSNELLTMAVRTFCEYGKDAALMTEYSFVAYGIVSQAHNLEVRRVPLKTGFETDLAAMARAVDEEVKIVFLANPNNPTGTYIAAEDLRAFLEGVPEDLVVVVDEAYHDYVQAEDYESALSMRDLHERLIVVRTLSKCYGLAGIRAGYAVAPAEMVDRMNRIREPFNCNLLAQAAVPAALNDREFVARSVAINEEGRQVLEAGLLKLKERGVEWVRSQTNFLLVKMPLDGRKVYQGMLQKGVIVRPMAGYGLTEWLRISLADRASMERCLRALEEVLDEVQVKELQ